MLHATVAFGDVVPGMGMPGSPLTATAARSTFTETARYFGGPVGGGGGNGGKEKIIGNAELVPPPFLGTQAPASPGTGMGMGTTPVAKGMPRQHAQQQRGAGQEANGTIDLEVEEEEYDDSDEGDRGDLSLHRHHHHHHENREARFRLHDASNSGGRGRSPIPTRQSNAPAASSNRTASTAASNSIYPLNSFASNSLDDGFLELRSCLHLAVAAGDSTLVALLLGRGAEVHLRDNAGLTPLNLLLDGNNSNNQILKLIGCKAISSLEESKEQLEYYMYHHHHSSAIAQGENEPDDEEDEDDEAAASPILLEDAINGTSSLAHGHAGSSSIAFTPQRSTSASGSMSATSHSTSRLPSTSFSLSNTGSPQPSSTSRRHHRRRSSSFTDFQTTVNKSTSARKVKSSLASSPKNHPRHPHHRNGLSNGMHHASVGKFEDSEDEIILRKAIAEGHAISTDEIEKRLNRIYSNPRKTSKYQSHHERISAMSELLKVSHFKTVKNIWISVLLIAMSNTLLYNYFESGMFLDFPLLFWCFSQFDHAILIWCILFACSFIAPLLEKMIIYKYISPRIAYGLFFLYSAITFIWVPTRIRHFNFPIATSMFVMCEITRIWMKMHSFLMVNRTLRNERQDALKRVEETKGVRGERAALREAAALKDVDVNVLVYPLNVTYEGYFYFLWAPTLVYQISYPRTKTIRWRFVITSFLEAAMTVLYTYAIFARYCVPYFPEMTGDTKSLVLGIFKVMIPGTAVALMGFYGLLHSWLNAWAEILRFADRQFYTDWWNATGWAQYYRRWNSVVHNFLHRHIFVECMETFHISKGKAMLATFIISAIVHEYIIASSFGFYKPIMLLMFLIPGVLFIYLTQLVGRGWGGWNVFMWFMLIVGHGMLVGLYSRAWYKHLGDEPLPWYDKLWIN